MSTLTGSTLFKTLLFTSYLLFNVQSDAVHHGTPVTKETFVAWKEQFDAEVARKTSKSNREVKLTGMCIIMPYINVTMTICC